MSLPDLRTNLSRSLSWRFRFSLRSMLILFFLVSLLGMFTNAAQRQKQAVAKIVKDGGWVKYDFQTGTQSTRVAPPWLVEYAGIDYFNEVVQASLSKDFHFVRVLPDLEFAEIVGGRIVDDNLKYIDRLRSLRRLHVRASRITEVGLERIGRNRRIEILDLGGTKLDGMSLEPLRSLKGLTELGLAFTNVDETQLQIVEGFPKLRKLSLIGCRISNDTRAYLTALNLPQLKLDPLQPVTRVVRRAQSTVSFDPGLEREVSASLGIVDLGVAREIRTVLPAQRVWAVDADGTIRPVPLDGGRSAAADRSGR